MLKIILSCIFCCVIPNLSVGDINSITKSGSIGANPLFCLSVNAFHLKAVIQLTSGERIAPLDSLNPVEESKTIPSFVRRFQIPTWRNIAILCDL